ncbi:hypothetical protein SOX05_08795 [Pseudomonas putida]|nr:hypothetical protein [Pseudomonas putida]MDY4319359.1 hypothetical protein [Pseudomonas putida]MDY4352744.1 hypothetical protein [Pseudomonas putida]
MISKNKQLATIFKANYLAATLLVFGIILDTAYLLLCLFSNPTPFAELPTTGKIALALPLFAMMIYAYKKLALIATGGDQIQQLIKLASESDKEAI